jgi:hypothetical protein
MKNTMKGVIVLLLITLSLNINGQENLVYNGSFEEYWYCPPPISRDSFPCKYWHSTPFFSIADYFNSCSQDTFFSVPCNDRGCYLPKSGNAYIGIIVIGKETGGMEYIQGTFKEPLIKGQKYKISFWVRLAYQYSDYAIYNIGAYISKYNIFSPILDLDNDYCHLLDPTLKAQITNKPNNFIIDTGWVEISGIYRAQGGERFITIGCFWDDTPEIVKAYNKVKINQSYTNSYIKKFEKVVEKYMLMKNELMLEKYENWPSKISDFDGKKKNYAYYLIDDVSVIELDE